MSTKFILFVFANVFCTWQYVIGGPTVVPSPSFDANKDADIIWKAVDGMGTDEDKISKVICKRTYKERVLIANAFERKHNGKSLRQVLEKETSGNLREIYKRLLESPQAVLANDLYDYVEGKRKDKYGGVNEILCGTDATDKTFVAAYYMEVFNMDVMDHVKNKYKSGDEPYQKVLYDQCWRIVCQKPRMNAAAVDAAALALVKIDPLTDKENFKLQLGNLYASKCEPDLQAIFIKYRSKANRGIDDAVKAGIKGDEGKAWVALVQSTENRYKYYANLLYEAVDGAGTDEDRINRITAQTCERFLGDIDNEYKSLHRKSFYRRISGLTGEFATEGDYKDCMKLLYNQ